MTLYAVDEILWRAKPHDICFTDGSQRTYVTFERWRVERATPTGFWLVFDPPGDELHEPVPTERVWRRRVERFARRSKAEALQSAIMRTRKWVQIERARLRRAERRLDALMEIEGGNGDRHVATGQLLP